LIPWADVKTATRRCHRACRCWIGWICMAPRTTPGKGAWSATSVWPSLPRSDVGRVGNPSVTRPNGQPRVRCGLDLLVLRTLALEPMHGWGIAQRIQQVSGDALQIGQGSLYPALHRLEYKGWVLAEWRASENNRRAKYYSLTRTGRKQLDAELKDWERVSTAIALVLK
jgi:PadR family transcriptional regulator, regulatory protein PadR